jgi:toxin FitB
MKRFVFDTNVLSEQTKPKPNLGVTTWLSEQKVSSCLISIVSIAEIEQGILLLGKTKRAQGYRDWLANLEREYFGNIIVIDREIATAWAEITSRAMRSGQTQSYSDAWIAATAIVMDAAVVTRNTDDFKAFVPVLNPWAEPLN